MITRRIAIAAIAIAATACGVDDRLDEDSTDPVVSEAIDVDIDVHEAVAGVVVTFATDKDPAGCRDTDRCSVRFGNVAADVFSDDGAVAAIVPAGAVSGPACLTLDGVERCNDDFTIVDAPRIDTVTLRLEPCPCRCTTDVITVLELHGAAFPGDAIVQLDGEQRGVTQAWLGSDIVELWLYDELTPGTHSLIMTAPSHDDAESNAFTITIEG